MLVSLTSGPLSLQVWGAPRATSRTSWKPQAAPEPRGTDRDKEGGTAAEKLVKPGAEFRPGYKDGAIARGLGKSLFVLIKVQD